MINRSYMKGIEFKSRQLWLDFDCAIADALRAVADGIEGFRAWFKAWQPKKTKDYPAIQTLPLFQHRQSCYDFQL
jgi:antibiotic biosynthesis monooxygenase (ABM) superfamily enzyme